jgi:hypothetical protein
MGTLCRDINVLFYQDLIIRYIISISLHGINFCKPFEKRPVSGFLVASSTFRRNCDTAFTVRGRAIYNVAW